MKKQLPKLALTASLGLAITLIFTQEAAAAEKPPEKAVAGTFTDIRDKRTYKTIKIGRQTWMAENLNVKTGVFWCYGNYESNCKKYGRLYDLETAREACPSGWHLPSKEEWEVLVLAAGLKMKPDASCYGGTVFTGARKLKANNDFAALSGGSRCASFGIKAGFCDEWMGDVGVSGKWWASDVDEEDGCASSIEIKEDEANLCMDMSRFGGGFGYSVRCVKD